MKISGRFIDVFRREIYPALIDISEGRIESVERKERSEDCYIMPGLIDAHVHIESSMLSPVAFAETAVKHGTVAVISDPHEIANVLGVEGVEYMIENSKVADFKVYFGAPSCVPATYFETSGAALNSVDVSKLLLRKEIVMLSEVMNFPAVVNGEREMLLKIQSAKAINKPIDGHAPGLKGEELKKYIDAGISTDHECAVLEDAIEKIGLGMKIQIREGSAARNLEALHPLFAQFPEKLMLCCDDIHPEMLEKGHINVIIRKLLGKGYDLFDVIRAATKNPVEHYNLDTGLLREGDKADFIIVEDLDNFKVLETWIDGRKVFDRGEVSFSIPKGKAFNKFNCSAICESDIEVKNQGKEFRLIKAVDGDLFTYALRADSGDRDCIESDISKDILKIIVKDRYNDAPPSVGFISGFGLKSGAFAGSVAHDSHNIIAIGVDDESICKAVNRLVEQKGGLSVCRAGQIWSFPLEIAGLMSNVPCGTIAGEYEKLSDIVKDMGCQLNSPFMTLSFMALLVIPELKLSDKGLFDLSKFELTDLII